MTESPEPAETATPAVDVASLIAAAAEQVVASLDADGFAALVARVRPPDEAPQQPAPAPVQPHADRPSPRVPIEPTEQQQRDHERYSSQAYPPAWGYQRQEPPK